MKYVRTDTDVYAYSGFKALGLKFIRYKGHEIPLGENEKIVKESNIIEKLCDRFVLAGTDIIFLSKDHKRYRFEGSNEWNDITEIELRVGIYGAIWTKRGLKFVARMVKTRFKILTDW